MIIKLCQTSSDASYGFFCHTSSRSRTPPVLMPSDIPTYDASLDTNQHNGTHMHRV